VSARLVLTLAVLALLTPAASAQQYDRRARDEPEVVVKPGGRVGTADAIEFSATGEFLFGVGDDKVVHVWPHSATGLDTTLRPNNVLRWRSWRDQLGGIKALAISPDGKRVVVGGYGLRVSTVAILDRETGETLALTWPKTKTGDHYDAVMAVAFDGKGKRVGFGTADGTLWLWDPEKLTTPDGERVWRAPTRVGRFTPLKGRVYNFPRNVRFSDDKWFADDTLIAVAQTGQVVECKIDGELKDDPDWPTPPAQTLFDTAQGLKSRYFLDNARWTGDGKWLVVTTDVALVLVRSADGKEVVELKLPKDHFARSIAVHPETGKIALGITSIHPGEPGKPRFYAERDDAIWVYNLPTEGVAGELMKIPHVGRAEALAFHPTEDRLAIAGGDADEVTLLDLAKREPEKEPVSVVRGVGRRLHAIKLSESGDVFAVRTGRNAKATDPNDRGRGPWVHFNIPRFITTADEGDKWLGPLAEAAGWKIVPHREWRFVWFAERGKDRLQLILDPDLDQSPTCFTFVPTPADKPARVIVGHYYGCSLFELDPARAIKDKNTGQLLLRRTKLYIGHGAEVNAVVADKTGTWFLTAGADQTVAAWSLKDWQHQPALGAAFTAKDGLVVVSEVDAGSPAWEAGLSKGDRIVRLAIGGEYVFDATGKNLAPAAPDRAVKALSRGWSGVEHHFLWETPGQPGRRESPCHIKQRPLWKWFAAFDKHDRVTDTITWMWHGSYYYTRSTHGDRLVGWHVNHAQVGGTPLYHTLERYKHLFFREQVMIKLVESRSVADALKLARGDNPERPSFRQFEPDPVVLDVKQAVVPRDGGVAVRVAVQPSGNNPDLIPHRIELWVNDCRYRAWATKGKDKFAADEVIPASAFRAGDNQITVLALNPARGRAEKALVVHNPAKPEPPTLIGLMGGIDDYAAHRKVAAGARGAFDNLTKAGADVTGLRDGLLRYRGKGKHFPAGDVATLLNVAADRNGLTGALAKLKGAAVKPDDLLVVFLAGHGDLLDPNGKPILQRPAELATRGLPAEGGQFVFCCPDYSPAKPTATSLAAEELFEALAEVNCRKLVLLDACHSGGALQANLLRRFIPNGQGPIVIAACAPGQASFEDDAWGHGAFTYAVLEALGKQFRADRDRNGELTPAELYDYLADRVPAIVAESRPGKTQNPICFPERASLPKITLVKQ
jgi:WD40 repeat protein